MGAFDPADARAVLSQPVAESIRRVVGGGDAVGAGRCGEDDCGAGLRVGACATRGVRLFAASATDERAVVSDVVWWSSIRGKSPMATSRRAMCRKSPMATSRRAMCRKSPMATSRRPMGHGEARPVDAETKTASAR